MEKFRKTGVIGLKAMDDALERRNIRMRNQERPRLVARGLKMKRPPRVGNHQSGTFLAYEKLNGRVSDALRRLGEHVADAFSQE